jgi:hypothetical protein
MTSSTFQSVSAFRVLVLPFRVGVDDIYRYTNLTNIRLNVNTSCIFRWRISTSSPLFMIRGTAWLWTVPHPTYQQRFSVRLLRLPLRGARSGLILY